MHILILGGTQFVGRHIVEQALERGHTPTLFSRGQKPNPFPALEQLIGDRDGDLSALEQLIGDRDGDLSALEGRRFDAVIDVSGYTPAQLRRSTALLEPRVGRYLLISTVSVYAPPFDPAPHEDSPVLPLEAEASQPFTPERYGALKAAAEQVALEVFGARASVIRPHFVVGAWDHTDRLTSWIERLTHSSAVLLGGTAHDPLQFVDARDLGALCLHALEHDLPGTFNAARDPLDWATLIAELARQSGQRPDLLEPDPQWLEAQALEGDPFPMWIPGTSDWAALANVHNARSREHGFVYRPLEDTVRHLLEWNAARPWPLKVGLAPAREAELIAAWQARAH